MFCVFWNRYLVIKNIGKLSRRVKNPAFAILYIISRIRKIANLKFFVLSFLAEPIGLSSDDGTEP